MRQQLGQLFFETPAIFIGFDDADGDLTVLQSIVTNGYNGQQKHSTHTRELLDGITTQPGDQSSPDHPAHELSPGDHPLGSVTSSQDQDVTSKDKRSEKEPTPDIIKQEPISIPAPEGQYKGNGRNTGSPPPHLGSTPSHESQNGQTPVNNPETASAEVDETQLRALLESRFSSGILQLPDELPLFNKFKALLKTLLSLKENPEKMRKTRDLKRKQFTLLENNQETLSLAFIYIPGFIMNEKGLGI